MGENVPSVGFRFERIEKKFWMSAEQYKALLPTLEEHLNYDQYGISTVCNLYCDTPDYTLIRRSIERPRFKEKLRIRSYGIPGEDDKVFVEIKRKFNGIGYKRRISVSFSEAKRLISGERIQCSNPQIESEIAEFVKRYRPLPAVLLTYRRFAMFGKDDPEFRVTFDRDLKYSTENVNHPTESLLKPVMDDDTRVLMELKSLSGIPRWLQEAMSSMKIYQAPFSKIGTCYTKHIAGGSYGTQQ